MACNDDNFAACGGSGLQSQLDVSLAAGKTYYIRVAGYNGEVGNYVLNITGPRCTEPILGDLTGDCYLDFRDFAIFALGWLDCKLDPPELCPQ